MKRWTLMLAIVGLLLVGATDVQAAGRGTGPGDGTCQIGNQDGSGQDGSQIGSMFRKMFGEKWGFLARLGFGVGGRGDSGYGPGDGTGNDGDGPQDGTGNGNSNGDGTCDGSGTGECDGTGQN